ncbi:hypothetical protein AURDEDRAFT_179328 [Auricularia subglabra TFB-10046 SS5]|nr:hypothetical protein AURDEDRAFT_179328 [Auricularia subglabra TFB-10046 SS5]
MLDFQDITQNAFLMGVPAATWQTMLASAYERLEPGVDMAQVCQSILGAILHLFPNYPADQTLLAYIRVAVQGNFVPLSFALSYFVTNASHIQDAATLHVLFKCLLDIHFASGASPYGSIITFDTPMVSILELLHACLPLVKSWDSIMAATPFHGLQSPISQLVVLLVSCLDDLASVTTAHAGVYFNEVSQVLHTPNIDQTLRHALENYMMALSMVLGDNAKAAREVEMMQALHLSMSKSSAVGGTASFEIITFGTLLRHLFDERADSLSFGNTDAAVAILRATQHYTGAPLQPFYTQLLLAAFDIIGQVASHPTCKLHYEIWCSLIVSRLPFLLRQFEHSVSAEIPTDASPRTAMQSALRDVFSRADVLRRLDLRGFAGGEEKVLTISSSFLRAMIEAHFIDQDFLTSIGQPPIVEQPSRLSVEAQEYGMDLETFIESRITSDGALQDGLALLDRAIMDFQAHGTLSEVLHRRFIALASTQDVEPLSHMCSVLSRHDAAVDIVAMHTPLSDLIGHALHFVNNFSCEGVGDPQTAVSQFGVVVQFLQLTVTRYHMHSFSYTLNGRTIRAGFLLSCYRTYTIPELSQEEHAAFLSWHKALFGRDSDGIDDNILRQVMSTNPLTLLRIAPTLLSEAVAQAVLKTIDGEALRNGVQFFLGPLLNWTLVGVVKSFVADIDRLGYCATMHIEALKTIISPTNQLPIVFRLCGQNILRMVPDPQSQNLVYKTNELKDIKRIAIAAVSKNSRELQELDQRAANDFAEFPSLSIRGAVASARASGAPGINVRHSLITRGPMAFLNVLWAELHATSSDLGHDVEIYRRLASHVLVASALHAYPECPPLLPLFLNSFVPRQLEAIDMQMFGDQQTREVDLLVAILSSAMAMAFHLERSLNTLPSHAAKVAAHRLKTAGLAARLFYLLRTSASPAAGLMRERLSSIPSFSAMYPEFAN